jgi:Bax protein
MMPEAFMTTRRFDSLILSFIGGAVIVTAAASLVSPQSGLTANPRLSFDQAHAEAAHLNQGVREIAPEDMEVAAGVAVASLRDAHALAESFDKMGYHLDRVREDGTPVPRVFLAEMPRDLHAVPEVSLKKTVFFQTMLPLILQENERILSDRHQLIRLKAEQALGGKLSARDRLWLAVLAERYKVKDENLDTLLRRVDVIPPSLAMAQAAEESGWGTSRFAQHGNAIYGQWTTAGGEGLIPEERPEGMDHKVRSFDNLEQSVAAYIRNLNTHRAYLDLRKERSKLRRSGEALDGLLLAESLTKYSERGKEYIESVRTIIDVNGLRELDDARLVADKTDDDQSV